MTRPATVAPLVAQAPRPLREYVEELERQAGDDFRVDRIGASHSADPESSHRAALANFPRSGNQRRRVLEALAARKAGGATFEELIVDTGIKSAAKRLTELKAGGWAIAANTFRKTSMGATAEVYLASAKALSALEAERSPHQAAGGGASSPSTGQAIRDQGTPCPPEVAAPSATTHGSAGGGDGVLQGSSAQGPASSSPPPADQEPLSLLDDEPMSLRSTSHYADVEAA